MQAPIDQEAVWNTFIVVERQLLLRKGIVRNDRPIDVKYLKPYVHPGRDDGRTRYLFLELINIINWKICGDQRSYGKCFANYSDTTMSKGFTPQGTAWHTEVKDDFWMVQCELFNRELANNQNNTLYIGLDPKIIKKKLGRSMTKFEWKIQELYNDTFKHLTHNKKQDRIKVYVSW